MILKQVQIYQTPLDVNYNNVLDLNDETWLNSHELGNHLTNIYDSITAYYYTATSPTQRAFNLNKETEFTFNYSSSTFDFVRKCNWAVLTSTDDKEYYYFITKYVVNDNFTTITLYLRWDAWTNNIANIVSDTTLNHIERRHIDDFTKPSGNISYGKNFISNEEELPVTRTAEKRQDQSDIVVIYTRYWLKGEHINFEMQPSGTLDDGNILRSLNPIKIVLRPFCFIDRNTREIVNCQYYFTGESTDPLSMKFPDYPYTQLGVQTIGAQWETSLIYTDFTVCPGLYYFVEEGPVFGKRIRFPYRDLVYADILYNGTKFSEGFVNIPTDSQDGSFEENLRYSCNTSGLNSVYTSKLFSSIYEPRIHYYPYEYTSYKFGDNIIDLIPKYNTTKATITYRYENKISPQLHIKFDNELRPVRYYNSQSVGNCPIVIDSLSEYLMNNSNQIKTDSLFSKIGIAISGLNTVSSLAGGNISSGISNASGAIKGIHNLMNIESRIKDANERQDTYTIPSIFAIDDINFQDDLIRLFAYVPDTKEKERVLKRFIMYGVNYDNYSAISENTRNNFDYIKTADCNLPNIKNNEDRKIIENAFNKGLRKWHIDTCYSVALETFDMEYTNLQKSIYTPSNP